MVLQDHFLIAMPNLDDPFFRQSVVYLCEHNEQGAMGLTLTHATDLSIAELIAKANFMMAEKRQYTDDIVLVGGPTNVQRGFILHSATEQQFEHSYKLTDNLLITTSSDIIQTFGTRNAPQKYLVTLGCASWEASQLEKEIANNSWLVIPSNESLLFDVPHDQRWLVANQSLGITGNNLIFQAGRA